MGPMETRYVTSFWVSSGRRSGSLGGLPMTNVPAGHHDSLVPSTSRSSRANDPSKEGAASVESCPQPSGTRVGTASTAMATSLIRFPRSSRIRGACGTGPSCVGIVCWDPPMDFAETTAIPTTQPLTRSLAPHRAPGSKRALGTAVSCRRLFAERPGVGLETQPCRRSDDRRRSVRPRRTAR